MSVNKNCFYITLNRSNKTLNHKNDVLINYEQSIKRLYFTINWNEMIDGRILKKTKQDFCGNQGMA